MRQPLHRAGSITRIRRQFQLIASELECNSIALQFMNILPAATISHGTNTDGMRRRAAIVARNRGAAAYLPPIGCRPEEAL
jgi:hypothetical protein